MKALAIAFAFLVVFGLGLYIGAAWQSQQIGASHPRNYPLSK